MPINFRDRITFLFNQGRGILSSQVEVDASGFSQVLATTDNDIQKVADKLDTLSLTNIDGMISDGQIPSTIMRDAEFTAAAIQTLLSLSSSEVNDLLTGATISGQILTFTQNDGTTVPITIPTATAGSGDGVVQSGSFNASNTELTLTLDNAGTVTIDIPAALRMSGGITEARVQELIDGTSISALQGSVTDSQIPDAIMRDAEFTVAAIRNLLNLTNTEVNDLLVGATITGQVLTFTQNDGSTITITIPTAMAGSGDGVVSSGAIDAAGTELTLTLDTGGTVVVNIPAILRSVAGITEARVQELIEATSISALQGLLTDGQIPAAIMRDAEFTAAAVRNLLSLTATEVNDILVGAAL